MKKLLILCAVAATTFATVVPADALVVGVGPRGGVRVGVGARRGFVRRGPVIAHPFVRRGPVVVRRVHRI